MTLESDALAASLHLEQSIHEFVHEHVRVRDQDTRAAKEFFAWCCQQLKASADVAEILPSGSFARGTCIRPLHDIDALVRFDLNGMRAAGVHEGTNLQLSFLAEIVRLLAPQHQRLRDREWSYVAHTQGRPFSLRRQACSVGVCMDSQWSDSSITFDFVPCIKEDGPIEILHRAFGRVKTDPAAAATVVDDLDRAFDGGFRTAVQLMKHWNRQQRLVANEGDVPRQPFKSFQLELLCCEFANDYFNRFGEQALERGHPLLQELILDLFTFLRMHYRSDVDVPGVEGGRMSADPSIRLETHHALNASWSSLQQARRSILAGDAHAAAERWREVFGPQLHLSSARRDERHLPQWRLSAARAAARGPLLRAAEAGETSFPRGIGVAPTTAADVGEAISIASALDHDETLAALLEDHDVSAAQLQDAVTLACRNDCSRTLELLLSRRDLAVAAAGGAALQLPLGTACHYASAEVVARLLRAGARIDQRLPNGTTGLMAAAVAGAAPTLQLLLRAGATVDAVDDGDRTALFFACENGHEQVVAALLREGADPTRRSRDGYSSLYAACAEGHGGVVRLLMARPEVRATSNDSMPDGYTPLSMAAVRGAHGVVAALLEHQEVEVAASCEAGWTALGFAAQEGNVEIARLLLAHGAPVDAPRTKTVKEEEAGGTPLLSAAKNGHVEMVRLLLAHGADVRHQPAGYSVSALHLAVTSGLVEMVELLLDAGADLDARAHPPFSSPLRMACVGNHPQIAELLLERGAQVDVPAEAPGCAFCAYHHGWSPALLARFVAQTRDVAELSLMLRLAKQRLEPAHQVVKQAVARWKELEGVTDSWLQTLHIGFSCGRCGASSIAGARHHCSKCEQFDVCSGCFNAEQTGNDGCQHELIEMPSDPFMQAAVSFASQ